MYQLGGPAPERPSDVEVSIGQGLQSVQVFDHGSLEGYAVVPILFPWHGEYFPRLVFFIVIWWKVSMWRGSLNCYPPKRLFRHDGIPPIVQSIAHGIRPIQIDPVLRRNVRRAIHPLHRRVRHHARIPIRYVTPGSVAVDAVIAAVIGIVCCIVGGARGAVREGDAAIPPAQAYARVAIVGGGARSILEGVEYAEADAVVHASAAIIGRGSIVVRRQRHQ
mmetsp:Transcript_6247/g.15549  ORF Transcript_6247/g.15549 Transcript_6247/m.15549 type:complete len:220 (-) Transcript_6247:108-767(-)